MDELDDISLDYLAGAEDLRVLFFERLRELIMLKDQANDEIAAAVLGWAYEQLAEV